MSNEPKRSPKFELELKELIRRARLQNVDKATDDLLGALTNFPDLRAEIVNFQFPNEGPRYTLSITGTIPIQYKNSKYHIPVSLYFFNDHPYRGPYCYVRPTASMRIRVSAHVDDKGRIFLPYLTEWSYPGYDTLGLLQVMTITFQEKCPVFSVVSQPQSSAPQNPAPNSHPYPSDSFAPTQHPPYPTPGITTPYPYSTSQMMPQPQPSGTAYTPYPSTAQPGYQPPYPPVNRFSTPSVDSLTHDAHQLSIPKQNAGSGGYGYSNNTLQPSHVRISLISAIEDRFRTLVSDKLGTTSAEIQTLESDLRTLSSGKQKLRGMLDKIEKEQAQMDSILSVYETKKTELNNALKSAEEAAINGNGSGGLKPEDAIDAPTPLYRQIVKCYVKDNAIDDTIYFLGTALKNQKITLPIYLKAVRELSRKQFKERATLFKARQKSGLPV